MPIVRFNHSDIGSISLKGKNIIKRLIIEIFISEGKNLNTLNYIFCSDTFLLGINKKFLKHNDYTDIISFDLSESNNITGEIYISVERVKENAFTQDVSFKNELCRVIIHGALHLCGYKDKKKSEITVMREKEDYYLHLIDKKFK